MIFKLRNRTKKGKIAEKKFNNFINDISKTKVLVLFGLGLTSDPHLLEEINKISGRFIVIIDANKEKYYSSHFPKSDRISEEDERKFLFLKNNIIFFIDTVSRESQSSEPFLIDRDDNFIINTPEKLIDAMNQIFDIIKNKL